MTNKNRLGKATAIIVLGLTLGGCETVTKQQIGTGLGGIAGGLAGSLMGSGTGQLIATAFGSFAGGLAGGEIGGRLDRADREKADAAAFNTLEYAPDGKTIEWQNPDSRTRGTMTATRTDLRDTSLCREFVQSVSRKDQTQSRAGKACRTEEGSWQVVQLAG